MRMLIYLLAFLSCYLCFAEKLIRSDQVNLGSVLIGTPDSVGSTANASASLEVKSTSKGFLPPRMTTAQRDAISSPATGLIIYNTSSTATQFYNGSAWKTIGTSGLTASRALETDASGDIASSAVTSTELNYLDGVSSSVQDQINAKQADVITAQGSIVIGGAGGAAEELALGAADFIIKSNGTTAVWAANSGGAGADAETVISLNDFTANSGFETGDTTNWTNSGASFSVQDTNVLDGSYSASWDAAADGNTLTSDAFTIPNKLAGNNVTFCFLYKGGDTNIRWQVLDNSANVLINDTLSAKTDSYLHCNATGVASTVTGLQFKLESDDDAAVIYADNFSFALSSLVNISQLSQTTFYGSATYPVTASCLWTDNSSTMEGFDADADCTSPTGDNLAGNALAATTKIPAIRFTNLPAGDYMFKAYGNFKGTEGSSGHTECNWRLHDGTNYTKLVSTEGSTSTISNGIAVVGRIPYTTTQSDITIQIQYDLIDGVACQIDVTEADFTIDVYRFPLSSQTAYTANTTPLFWQGYHDTTCLWASTNTSYVLDGGDATCTLTEQINNNFGSITSLADGTGNQSALVIPFPKTGTFEVCASGLYKNSNNGAWVYLRLQDTDDDLIILDHAAVKQEVSDYEQHFKMCGLLAVDAVATRNIGIKIKASANTATVTGAIGNLYWTVKDVSQNFPMPQILNNLESSASGGGRTCSALVASDGTVSGEEGDCISSTTVNATGDYTITFSTGVYSSAPKCVCNRNYTDVGRVFCTNDGVNATNTSIDMFVTNAADGAGLANPFSFICIGDK